MPGFDDLRIVLASVRIAHHISGRIRLKLQADAPRLDLSPDLGRRFGTLLDRIPGVHAVRANALALSCTVEYDPRVIPTEAWGDFLAGTESPAAAVLEQILRDIHREITNAEL